MPSKTLLSATMLAKEIILLILREGQLKEGIYRIEIRNINLALSLNEASQLITPVIKQLYTTPQNFSVSLATVSGKDYSQEVYENITSRVSIIRDTNWFTDSIVCYITVRPYKIIEVRVPKYLIEEVIAKVRKLQEYID